MSNTQAVGRLLDASHAAVELLDTIHDDPAVQLASVALSNAAAAVSAEALASTDTVPMTNTQAERVDGLMQAMPMRFSISIGNVYEPHVVRSVIASLVAENEALRVALRTAVDHIEMEALRISHCKDADLIDAARNTTQQQGG